MINSFFPTLKIDGYCCTQSMIDADIQHLYQETRLPLGKHVKHLVRFDFITFCPGLKSLNVPMFVVMAERLDPAPG